MRGSIYVCEKEKWEEETKEIEIISWKKERKTAVKMVQESKKKNTKNNEELNIVRGKKEM